jgi:hypothetical protein
LRPAPRIEDLDSSLASRVLALYKTLGGQLAFPSLRPGPWDLSMDGLLIELDEELHFNRYRAMALAEVWADPLPWAEAYRDMSRAREPECHRAGQWGQRWTSSGSERLFGRGAPPGDLAAPGGAPRWKQRALYDAMKDAVALTGKLTVARLSVYDVVSGKLLGNVLGGRGSLEIDDLMTLLRMRAS